MLPYVKKKKRVFAGVIKLRILRRDHPEFSKWTLNPGSRVSIRERQREIWDRQKKRDTEQRQWEDKAEIGVMCPQAEEAREPAAARTWKAGKDFPLEALAVRIVDALSVPAFGFPCTRLDFRTRQSLWSVGGGRGPGPQQRLGAAGSVRLTAEAHRGAQCGPAQRRICLAPSCSRASPLLWLWNYSWSSAWSLFLAKPSSPPPTSVILEVIWYSLTNIFLLHLARTDSVLHS